MKQFTTEEFINKSKEIFGNLFTYENTIYINSKMDVIIICKIHGDFIINPNNHLHKKQGCSKCKNQERYTEESFLKKLKSIHTDDYDYSLFKYVNNKIDIILGCKKHGFFNIRADHSLVPRCCKKCLLEDRIQENKQKFIIKSIEIHNNIYDYSLINYINSKIEIKIICHKHGIFEQTPNIHIDGSGCPFCNESKGEKEIVKILDGYNIKYERQKRFNSCRYKLELPFDFYLPEYNICIEFDGIQHFHVSEKFGGEIGFHERQLRDKIKTDYCLKNNIKLIRIAYYKNILKTLKKHKLFENF